LVGCWWLGAGVGCWRWDLVWGWCVCKSFQISSACCARPLPPPNPSYPCPDPQPRANQPLHPSPPKPTHLRLHQAEVPPYAAPRPHRKRHEGGRCERRELRGVLRQPALRQPVVGAGPVVLVPWGRVGGALGVRSAVHWGCIGGARGECGGRRAAAVALLQRPGCLSAMVAPDQSLSSNQYV